MRKNIIMILVILALSMHAGCTIFGTKSEKLCDKSQANQTESIDCKKLEKVCKQHKGYPYVWGGESVEEGGYDCSGFIFSVAKKIGNPLPRTTARKYWLMMGEDHHHWKKAECRDLVWWTLTPDRPYGHIGIVTFSPKFWQSGSSHGVYSRKFFEGSYWDKHFVGAKEGI